MKKIELTKAYVDGNTIRYEVQEEPGLGLLQNEVVELFVKYHFNDTFTCDLSKIPSSILVLPISIYLYPITFFYDVELVIPEMDKELYAKLPSIYEAYSKVYGPFEKEWQGKVTVKKIVDNRFSGVARYDNIVFFSGGVDACHAGINNSGGRSLLVSIPDIECKAKSDGPLRREKFALIENFAAITRSDWLVITNNFNDCLFRNREINRFLGLVRNLNSEAYNFDGWAGIRYVGNMCSVAPIAYLTGVRSLVMGSAGEVLNGVVVENLDGVNANITNSFAFAGIKFSEQEGLAVRRSKKVSNIIEWCRNHAVKTKMWVCFDDGDAQCGFCRKCVRTQLNILCAGENPKDWGFDNFDEKKFEKFIRNYRYQENSSYFLWDNIETIDDRRVYSCLNKMLHWLKKIGHEKYAHKADLKARRTLLRRLLTFKLYPYYIKVALSKIF